MKSLGFTLIEVIVAMTIVSIMAAVLVPISYKIWDAQKEELTLSRMETLKKAMVGDPVLYQNGIRTDYGFVGDNGELPETLSELIPYLSGGFNPATYNLDAWGGELIYTTSQEGASGRYSAATLVSNGPDPFSETDNLEVTIVQGEVLPTSRIEGSLRFLASNYNSASLYARVTADVEGLPGSVPVSLGGNECFPVPVIPMLTDIQSMPLNGGVFALALPVGKAVVRVEMFGGADVTCSGALQATPGEMSFFVNQGSTMYVNLPTLIVEP